MVIKRDCLKYTYLCVLYRRLKVKLEKRYTLQQPIRENKKLGITLPFPLSLLLLPLLNNSVLNKEVGQSKVASRLVVGRPRGARAGVRACAE